MNERPKIQKSRDFRKFKIMSEAKMTPSKQYSEQRVEKGIKTLLHTLNRNWYDTGILLDDFETAHNDYELSNSKQYAALVAGHFALKSTIEEINKILNK